MVGVDSATLLRPSGYSVCVLSRGTRIKEELRREREKMQRNGWEGVAVDDRSYRLIFSRERK